LGKTSWKEKEGEAKPTISGTRKDKKPSKLEKRAGKTKEEKQTGNKKISGRRKRGDPHTG